MAAPEHQELLDRLTRLYALRNIIVNGRRRRYLEKSEAEHLVNLLEEIITDLSGGRASVTLHLVSAVREFIRQPGKRVRKYTLEEFGRDDVIPMPEYLVEALPEPTILELIRKFRPARLVISFIAENMGLNPRVIEALLDIRLRDLVTELGYQLESLLETAGDYAQKLQSYILNHGLSGLNITRQSLSTIAEVTGRAWLSLAKKGPWQAARPVAKQARRVQYEFDAVAYELVEDRIELYVAEIELRCIKFLEYEEGARRVTSIEGKIKRLKHLLDTFRDAYSRLGINQACLKSLVLMCYDKPSEPIRNELMERAKNALRTFLEGGLCPGLNVEIIDGDEMVNKLRNRPPENRLKEAIAYIKTLVAGKP